MNGIDPGVRQQIQANERKSLRDEPGLPEKRTLSAPLGATIGSHKHSHFHFLFFNYLK